jgi:hypothetical protein
LNSVGRYFRCSLAPHAYDSSTFELRSQRFATNAVLLNAQG